MATRRLGSTAPNAGTSKSTSRTLPLITFDVARASGRSDSGRLTRYSLTASVPGNSCQRGFGGTGGRSGTVGRAGSKRGLGSALLPYCFDDLPGDRGIEPFQRGRLRTLRVTAVVGPAFDLSFQSLDVLDETDALVAQRTQAGSHVVDHDGVVVPGHGRISRFASYAGANSPAGRSSTSSSSTEIPRAAASR